MKKKSKIFTKFKDWKMEIENLNRRKNKILMSDSDDEHKDNKFLEFCINEGIKRHLNVKKTPNKMKLRKDEHNSYGV